MYQFTTTTILNSNLDSNGTTTKFVGSATGLNVTRVGSFKKANIVSIYKRPYQEGVKEIAVITVPTITAGLVARLEIDVRLSQQTNSEYANTALYFKKPVTVEVIATGTAATDAAALIAAVNGLKDRYGFSYVTASTGGGAVITITATDNNQRIFSIKVLKEVALTLNSNSIIQPEYEDVSSTTFSVTTAGKVGFGDDEYMIRSIMLPTYENSRYFGTNKEERPVIGGNYSQYTLRYSITKDGSDGIVGGGTSITTHVFYVKSDLVSAFETAISNVGLTVPATFQIAVGTTGLTIDVSDGDTDQITWSGGVGVVTFSSDKPTKASVDASTGLVTALAAEAAVVITATDAVGNTDTLTYAVTA
jgi:hypothetical protein